MTLVLATGEDTTEGSSESDNITTSCEELLSRRTQCKFREGKENKEGDKVASWKANGSRLSHSTDQPLIPLFIVFNVNAYNDHNVPFTTH